MRCSKFPAERISANYALAILALVVAVLAVLYFSFASNEDCLEIGIDGALFAQYIDQQSIDRTSFTQTGVDALRGGFDAYYPLMREYLLPDALTQLFTGRVPGKTLTYFLYTPLIIFAVFVLARVLAVSWAVGLLAGFLFSILGLPGVVHHFGQLQGNLHLNPHWSEDISLSLLVVASFWALDGRRRAANILLLFAPLLCVIIAVVSTGPQLFFMVPAMGAYGAASLFDASRLRDNWQRILAAVLVFAGMAALGFITYYYGLILNSPFYFFPSELKQHPVAWHLVSAFFWIAPFGRWVILLGLAGATWLLMMGTRRQRIFAVTHLLVSLIYFPVAYWIVFRSPNYHGSMPSYFELFMLPYAVLFASVIIKDAVRLVLYGLDRLMPARFGCSSQFAGLVTLAAIVAAFAIYNVDQAVGYPKWECPARSFNPLRTTPLVDVLRREIALMPGKPFRGVAATITGVDGRASVSWEDLHAHDYWLWRAVGNDHRSVGLWQFQIPTLFQLFTFTGPPYYLLLTDFLARPSDVQTRSELALTQINEKMMALWGVRYLISNDAKAPGKSIVSLQVDYTQPTVKRETLYLTEFPEVNTGNYSPTEVRRLPDFRSGLAALHEPQFDGRRTVVTDTALEGTYLPADDIELTYEKYGFNLRAHSASRSLLVLPVLYSHCWSVQGGSATLFRANLMQIGVKFSGSLNTQLVFRYGPIWAGGCRLDDISDLRRLNIKDARMEPRRAPKN